MKDDAIRKRRSIELQEAPKPKRPKLGTKDWFIIADGIFLLSASRAQTENSCLMNSVVALSSKNALEWTSADFDQVLNDGRRLYLDLLARKGYAKNSWLYFEDIQDLGIIDVGNSKVEVTIKDTTYFGEIGGFPGKNYDEYYAPLHMTLATAFKTHDHALVLIQGKWMAISKTGKTFTIVNSHNVGELGEFTKGKVARAHSCETLLQVSFILAAGATTSFKTDYHLHPVVVKRIGK